jgi:tRNA (guanine37-N1)-methyltransferase
MDLRDRLEGDLTEEELHHLQTSFDIVGDIAIIKVPDELEHRKDVIAGAVLEQHGNVNTVIRKTGERSGEFRTADYEVLSGGPTETMHREHGARFRLDPTTVYFSERLGHERQRVVEQIQARETVIDMFAGIGPFAILAARNADAENVYAFEKNPEAAAYLQENVRLNKVEDALNTYEGDVREMLPEHVDEEADRIIMNLPESADAFADLAVAYIRENGVIHYYTFVPKDDLWDQAEADVQDLFQDQGAEIEILAHEVCGHYNPAVERVCFDIRVEAKRL